MQIDYTQKDISKGLKKILDKQYKPLMFDKKVFASTKWLIIGEILYDLRIMSRRKCYYCLNTSTKSDMDDICLICPVEGTGSCLDNDSRFKKCQDMIYTVKMKIRDIHALETEKNLLDDVKLNEKHHVVKKQLVNHGRILYDELETFIVGFTDPEKRYIIYYSSIKWFRITNVLSYLRELISKALNDNYNSDNPITVYYNELDSYLLAAIRLSLAFAEYLSKLEKKDQVINNAFLSFN